MLIVVAVLAYWGLAVACFQAGDPLGGVFLFACGLALALIGPEIPE